MNWGSSNWTVSTARLLAIVIAVLFALCGIAAVVFARSRSIQADFLSFWAAGHLAVGGHPSAAYDLAQHRAVEAQAVPGVGVLPFPYPPPFLLALLPFGLFPFWIAFAAWIAVTAGAYLLASRRIVEPRFSFAQAAAGANFITGQNGFLTSAIFIGGTSLLDARPFLAGTILGLLSLKPQLAILLPVALLAGREWRAIGGGIVSSVVLLLIALFAFGMDSYRGFLALLPQFAQWLSAERWPLGELASTFAMLRSFGVPAEAAMAIHGAVAIAAAGLTARAWALKLETRVPTLAAATLLITPYLLTYDALLLSLPLAWLLRDRRNHWWFAAVWFLSLLPAVSYFTAVPNVIPLAAIIALWSLRRPGERSQGARSGGTSTERCRNVAKPPVMPPPNLGDPKDRAAYRRELVRVYRGWRWLGLAIICLGVAWVLLRGEGWDSIGIAIECIGWAILLTVIVMRSRYHRRRIRGA